MNIITATDSYKVSHWPQYPPGSQFVRAYFESRTGALYDETVFFDLQGILKKYLVGEVVTKEKIAKAKARWNAHLGEGAFNEAGWTSMLKKYHGRLPIRIKSVLEGTPVPVSNVLMTVENTDPEFYWLTNYLETLLVQTWYGSTVATRSRHLKKLILEALEMSGDPKLIYFKLQDFGFRGVETFESAGTGGAGHLLNFYGTDTFPGVEYLMDYYGAVDMPGFSIPASEHSTMTSWGREREKDAYENMLNIYSKGLVAIVSDSYDLRRAVSEIFGRVLHDKIMQRDGTLVIRPDSGDPLEIVPWIMKTLWERFGGTMNGKGFKVLDPHVRVIQGDGIEDSTVEPIFRAVMGEGFSADNLTLGSGGGLLQKLDRDTQRFAFKCNSIMIDGVEHDVFKQPKTDPTKNSKKGILKLIKDGSSYKTVGVNEPGEDQLVAVFDNGHLLVDQTLNEIRNRTKINGY